MPDRPLNQRLRWIRGIALGIAAATLIASAAIVMLARIGVEDRISSRLELHSRVLEGQTAAMLESAVASIGAVSEVLEGGRSAPDPAQTTHLLSQAIVGRNSLRSLSLVDMQGRIIASTTPENVEARISLARLGPMPSTGRFAIGPLLSVRDLFQLNSGSTTTATQPGIPVLRRVARPDAPALLLVAVLNADRFATQFAVLLREPAERSALFSFNGQLLAAGLQVPLPPGARPEALIPFTEFLPNREAGTYRGRGLDGQAVFGAFRTLRDWPLVVLVEEAESTVWPALAPVARNTAIAAAVVLLWLALGVGHLTRSARARHAAQLEIALAQREKLDSEERMKLALDGASLAVWDYELASGAITVSPRMYSFVGHQPGTLALDWLTIRNLIHESDFPSVVAAWLLHLRGDAPAFEAEFRVQRREGSWAWLLSRGATSPQRDSAGRPLRITGTALDVSARHEADAALRASQARQQAILASAIDAVVTIDSAGRVLDFNPAAEEMFGYALGQVRGQPMHDLLVPPELRQAHAAGMERYLVTGDSTILNRRREVVSMRANGTTFPAELAVVPVQTGQGQFFTATIRDLSQSKQALEKLARSDQQYRILFDNAPELILVVQDGQILMANASAVSIVGQQFDRIVGRPVSSLITADAREQVCSLLARRQQGDNSGTRYQPTTLVHSDGSRVPAEVSAVQIEWGGRPATLSFFFDIRERQEAERALRDSEARFRATFEQSAVGLLEQGFDRRILRVNQTLCDMLGYTRGQLVALSAEQLIHPDDVEPGLTWMRQLFAGDLASFQQEKRYRQSDGTYLWVQLTASVVRSADGTPLYMLAAIQNVSDRRRAQSELAASRARELAIGNRIQRELLVGTSTSSVMGLAVSVYNHPSQGIDGDFVEMFQFGDDTLDIIAGDVMGKGITAALLGAAVKMQFSRSLTRLLTLRGNTGQLPEPRNVVAALSRRMTPHLQALGAFITLVYLRVNVATGTVTWVGCGHEETLLISPRGESRSLSNQHPPIGILAEADYEQATARFREHDALFICSDGAADALVNGGERVGREALNLAATRRCRVHGSPAMALHGVRRDLLLDDVDLADDLTMVMVMRDRVQRSSVRLEVPMDLEHLAEVRRFVEGEAISAGFEEEETAGLTIASVEVFTNIVRHATGRVPGAPVELHSEHTPDGLIMEFNYFGDEFAPPDAVPEADLGEYPEGGFGLTIIARACDDVHFSHAAGVNTVRLAVLRPPD